MKSDEQHNTCDGWMGDWKEAVLQCGNQVEGLNVTNQHISLDSENV